MTEGETAGLRNNQSVWNERLARALSGGLTPGELQILMGGAADRESGRESLMPPSDLADNGEKANAFPWRFVTPLFMGPALNPINSSLIATALVPIAAAVHVPVGQTAASS